MDLVAGDRREILLALSFEDWDGLSDTWRFPAHLALGGLELAWLDQFAQAVGETEGGIGPRSFFEACRPLPDGVAAIAGDRTVEALDRAWLAAVAGVPDERVDRLAARWLDLLADDGVAIHGDDRMVFRQLAADLVAFARASAPAEDVLFAWSL